MKNWSWSTYITQQPTDVSNECGGHIADGRVHYTAQAGGAEGT